MRILNDKAQLFNRINIIDFLVILFLLCLLPSFYFGWRILTHPGDTPLLRTPYYNISKSCPNCGHLKIKEIPLGELRPLEWKGICEECGNEVWFIKKPKPKLKSKPNILPEEPNYEYIFKQIEYKQRLKEKGWLE